jgi:3'(2'), 5'-bisphosphate nucleotidase
VKPHNGFVADVPLADVTVYVDPLDATMEFVIGNKFCTIALIGIAVKNEAVGGVMCQPFEGGHEGRTLWAMVGFGAGDDCADPNKNVLTTPRPPHRKESVLVTTRLHNSPEVEKALNLIKPGIDNVVRVGGAGYKVLALLEGTADLYLYPTPGTKKWDTCGPGSLRNFCITFFRSGSNPFRFVLCRGYFEVFRWSCY